MSSRNRTAAGVPTGGQFAAARRSEPDVGLAGTDPPSVGMTLREYCEINRVTYPPALAEGRPKATVDEPTNLSPNRETQVDEAIITYRAWSAALLAADADGVHENRRRIIETFGAAPFDASMNEVESAIANADAAGYPEVAAAWNSVARKLVASHLDQRRARDQAGEKDEEHDSMVDGMGCPECGSSDGSADELCELCAEIAEDGMQSRSVAGFTPQEAVDRRASGYGI